MKNEPVADLWTFLVRLAQKNENDPSIILFSLFKNNYYMVL